MQLETAPKMPSTTIPITQPTQPNPRVGVGVFVLRPRKQQTTPAATTTTATPLNGQQSSPHSTHEFILGLRIGSHGANTWALPGGHLEFSESFETCATREVEEETGLTVRNVRFLTATNDVMSTEGKHYITVFVVAEVDGDDDGDDQEPRICEPNKCAAWEWVTWESLVAWLDDEGGEGAGMEKRNLFLPLVNLVRTRPGVVPSFF